MIKCFIYLANCQQVTEWLWRFSQKWTVFGDVSGGYIFRSSLRTTVPNLSHHQKKLSLGRKTEQLVCLLETSGMK